MTSDQFLQNTAAKGGSINTLFEERLFALVSTLERIAAPLAAESIPYEVIGGVAVMVQVDRVDSSAVRNTKDINIMIRRADLGRVNDVARLHGFTFRHPVRLAFAGEKTPPLKPEHLSVHGVDVAVIRIQELVEMKLSNNRDIDRVHIRDLDSVGLITAEIEGALPSLLRARLQEIRSSE